MKPLGTITMCFPHVDKDTKSVLQSVMDDSENYADFTERLCDIVCEQPSNSLLQYFAVYFPYYIDYYSLIDKLEAAAKISDLALPILLATKSREGEKVSWDDQREAMFRALKIAPNDWIASHLYLSWRSWIESIYPESDVDIQPIETITSSVDNNADLAYFKSHLHKLKAGAYFRENTHKEALAQLKQSLAIARKYDEQIMVADCICEIASQVKHTDVKQAIDLFISSREIANQLGYKHRTGIIQHELGHIMGFRGEMDAAIEYQFEYRDTRESLGLATEYIESVIAMFYNQIGNGAKAFELIQSVFNLQKTSFRSLALPYSILSWALINLGRYNDAKEHLATAHNLASQSGDSSQIVWTRIVEGVLDKAEKKFTAAIECFEEVLKSIEERPTPVIQNICLLNLTEIEIDMLTDESLAETSETSGHWMQKLVEHAERNDLPGIAARAKLLKAELRRRQGRLDDARKLIKEVQKTAEAPSMKYLNDLAISMFPEIIVS